MYVIYVLLRVITKTTKSGGRRAGVENPAASADAGRRRRAGNGGDLRKGKVAPRAHKESCLAHLGTPASRGWTGCFCYFRLVTVNHDPKSDTQQ